MLKRRGVQDGHLPSSRAEASILLRLLLLSPSRDHATQGHVPELSAVSLAAVQGQLAGRNCGDGGGLQDSGEVSNIASITRGLSKLSARAVEEYVTSSNAVLSRPLAGRAAVATTTSAKAGRQEHTTAAAIPESEARACIALAQPMTRGLSKLSARAVEEYLISSNVVLSRPLAAGRAAVATTTSANEGRQGHTTAA